MERTDKGGEGAGGGKRKSARNRSKEGKERIEWSEKMKHWGEKEAEKPWNKVSEKYLGVVKRQYEES